MKNNIMALTRSFMKGKNRPSHVPTATHFYKYFIHGQLKPLMVRKIYPMGTSPLTFFNRVVNVDLYPTRKLKG